MKRTSIVLSAIEYAKSELLGARYQVEHKLFVEQAHIRVDVGEMLLHGMIELDHTVGLFTLCNISNHL